MKSIALLTKPATAPTLGVWANTQVAINLIGADKPAADIGGALIQKGVSILRIYDPTPVVHRHQGSSPAAVYQAIVLAKLLAQEIGRPQTKIIGYPFRFDPVTAFPGDLAIVVKADEHLCTFDNNYLQTAKTPYLSVVLSPDGEQGAVLVYQPRSTKPTCAHEDTEGGKVVQIVTAKTITDVQTYLVSLVGEAAESIVIGRTPPWHCAQARLRRIYQKEAFHEKSF